MNFTGERWVFKEGGDDLIQREHMARYAFACSYIKGKKVLDVAAGIGYGSYLLATQGKAKEVVGADIDPESVAYANDHYHAAGLSYTVGDAQMIPFADQSFDVVVSFETIEHLPDQVRYLTEVKRVLKSGGLFLVSTPDREFYHVYNLGKHNKFHIKELSRQEFHDTLAKMFTSVKMFGQNPILVGEWRRSMKIEPIKRVIRAIDVLDLRKKAKKLRRSSASVDRSSAKTLYDSLDPSVRPLDDRQFVYMTAVCKK